MIVVKYCTKMPPYILPDEFVFQALITQTRAKQAATMSEVEWRGRTLPVKIDKARIFLLGLADNEAAIAQVSPSHKIIWETLAAYRPGILFPL